MPSSTRAPASRQALTMAARLPRVIASGSPRSVVAAQFDHHGGPVLLPAARPARATARSGVAADAGVDHGGGDLLSWPGAVPAARPSPAVPRRDAVLGRQAVAETSTVAGAAAARPRRPGHTGGEADGRLQCPPFAARGAPPHRSLIHDLNPSSPWSTSPKQVQDSTGTLTILHDIDFTWRRASRWPSSAPRARARARCCPSSPDWTRRARARREAGRHRPVALDDGRPPRARASVGFVFQSFQLLANLTALENVMLPLELLGRSDARARHRDAGARGPGRAAGAIHPKVLSGGGSSAWRWRAPSSCGRRCCWPTSPPAAWISPPASGDGADVRS